MTHAVSSMSGWAGGHRHSWTRGREEIRTVAVAAAMCTGNHYICHTDLVVALNDAAGTRSRVHK